MEHKLAGISDEEIIRKYKDYVCTLRSIFKDVIVYDNHELEIHVGVSNIGDNRLTSEETLGDLATYGDCCITYICYKSVEDIQRECNKL